MVDDAYRRLNPKGRRYESLKRLSDSEVLALALFQELRGMESERSFLRDAERFSSRLFYTTSVYLPVFRERARMFVLEMLEVTGQ